MKSWSRVIDLFTEVRNYTYRYTIYTKQNCCKFRAKGQQHRCSEGDWQSYQSGLSTILYSYLDYNGWTVREKSSARLQWENQPETIKKWGRHVPLFPVETAVLIIVLVLTFFSYSRSCCESCSVAKPISLCRRQREGLLDILSTATFDIRHRMAQTDIQMNQGSN